MPLYLQNFQAHGVLLNRKNLLIYSCNGFLQKKEIKLHIENYHFFTRLRVDCAYTFGFAFQANRHRISRGKIIRIIQCIIVTLAADPIFLSTFSSLADIYPNRRLIAYQ